MLMVAAARVMANQGIGGDDDDDDDDDSWCDDIPCVDGDIIGQWDYLTRTYDSPSFLNAPTPPLHHGQHESEQVPYLHSMGIAGAEQRADIPGSHGCALGHFDESVLSNKRRNLHGAAVALDPIQHVSAPEPLFRLQEVPCQQEVPIVERLIDVRQRQTVPRQLKNRIGITKQ
jgi:hypothetical protein